MSNKTKAFRCTECTDELFSTRQEALDHVAEHVEETDAFSCPECDALFEDADEAKACCGS